MAARRRVERLRPIGLALAALALSSCADDGSSPLHVVPTTPEAVVPVTGDGQRAEVGKPLAEPLEVRVFDRLGNALAGVLVTWEVPEGATASPAESRTDRSGIARATWTLGTAAGPQVARAMVADAEAASFQAEARPGPAAAAEVVGGNAQEGVVGEALPQPLVARVTDRFGNPVAGAHVGWRTLGAGGEVVAEGSGSDEEGIVRARWTLGTRTGEHQAVIDVANRWAATFTGRAVAGPPAAIEGMAGDGQVANVGDPLLEPLVARVRDAYDNPVAGAAVTWEVESGAGRLDSVATVSEADGRVRARWTLGGDEGTQTAVVRVPGAEPLRFSARARLGIDLTVAGAYVTQSVQRWAGDVPLLEGRPGYLRVFVVSDDTTVQSPDVRVRLYRDGALIDTRTITGGGGAPTAVVEGDHARTWNLPLDGGLMRDGLGILVEVNPDGAVEELDYGDNTFPASGAPLELDFRPVPSFRTTLVPVRLTGFDTPGNVTEANKDAWMADTRSMFPLVEDEVRVRAPFTTSATALDGAGWNTAISEVRALRTMDGSSDYYYGVLPNIVTSSYCGVGYLGFPTAVGLDAPGCAGGTMAHEFGHNFNRRHAPCGNPGGPDPDYPYPDGSIGVHGWDVHRALPANPGWHKDLMSYCGPEWISDYTYEAVLAFRDAEASAAGMAFAAAPERRALLVWGRVGPDGIVLEPAFDVVARPEPPRRSGPYRLAGYDAAGRVLFSHEFAPDAVGDLPGQRHFAFALPVDDGLASALARIEVRGEGHVATRVAGAAAPDPGVAAARARGGMARLRWDSTAYPAAVVRDPRSGRVLGIVRRGAGEVVTSGTDRVEVVFSDGVRSVARRVPIR